MHIGGAGAIASLLHDAFMNPIDGEEWKWWFVLVSSIPPLPPPPLSLLPPSSPTVIKQRLQMHNSPYKGAFNCARTIYQTEGIKAFYRSYTTQLSMNVPFQVTHFVSYEFLQDCLNYERKYDPISHMLSGAGAGAIASLVTNPLDVAKTLLNTRAQAKNLSSKKRISGMLTAMLEIYREKGPRGFYKGVTARVVHQMPSTAVCWSVYEFFKHILGIIGEGGGAWR